MSEITSINNDLIQIGGNLLQVVIPPEPVYPPYTMRLKFKNGVTPTAQVGTFTQISSSPNVWDYTYYDNDWSGLFSYDDNLLEIIGGNTSGITNMESLFNNCTSLVSVALFDTSSVTDMSYMFYGCPITTIPQFNTSNVTNMDNMFYNCGSLVSIPLLNTTNCQSMRYMFNYCTSMTSVPLLDLFNCADTHGMFRHCIALQTIPLFNTTHLDDTDAMFIDCYNVESGALALYNQMSSQVIPPSSHSMTFSNCGRDTTTGSSELSQIPSDWK